MILNDKVISAADGFGTQNSAKETLLFPFFPSLVPIHNFGK